MSSGEWKDIAGIDSADRQRVVRLVEYGAMSFRALRVFGQDYEPEALAATEAALSAKREAEHADLKRRQENGEMVVWPLHAPVAQGNNPWLENVPLRKGIETLVELPATIMPLLDSEAWRTGTFEFVDQHDWRRRWLLEGLQVADIYAGDSATVVKRPRGRPKGLGYSLDDVPDFEAMRQLVKVGRPITTAAKEIAWERYPNEQAETRVTRLRKDYSTWLAAQDDRD